MQVVLLRLLDLLSKVKVSHFHVPGVLKRATARTRVLPQVQDSDLAILLHPLQSGSEGTHQPQKTRANGVASSAYLYRSLRSAISLLVMGSGLHSRLRVRVRFMTRDLSPRPFRLRPRVFD